MSFPACLVFQKRGIKERFRYLGIVPMSEFPTTIIVPAHNEEAVISRTLSSVLRDAKPGEFDVIVACNGCDDRTAETVRRMFSTVEVFELSEASKTSAINAGLRAARGTNTLLLDADIEIDTSAVRALVNALKAPTVDAAIGHMTIDIQGASWPVRAFYRVWSRHPYLSNGKFAAVIALTRDAVNRIGELPPVVADDTYLRRQFSVENVAVVDEVSFRVRVPRTLPALIRVRSRVHRGNREVDRLAPRSSNIPREQASDLARQVLSRPALWADAPWYLVVSIAARLLARFDHSSWGRDLTSRQAVS
jgi:glycosyltransferase involved in cell wall biosynthesis